MPNGEELNEELEFKERVKKLSSDEKLDYLVDQVYDLNQKYCRALTKKQTSAISAVTSGVVSAVIAFVTTRFGGN